MTTHPSFPARGRGRPLAVVAALAGLALAGCSSDLEPGAVTEPAPSVPVPVQQQAVQWTDTVCGALTPVVTRIGAPPQFDLSAPADTQRAYSSYLAEAQTEATRALERVSAAGAPAVQGGEQIASDVRDDIAELRDDLGDAKAQVDQANPNDVTAMGRAVVAAGNVLGALANSAQALGTLDGNPRLDNAFEQAPACKQLREINTVGG